MLKILDILIKEYEDERLLLQQQIKYVINQNNEILKELELNNGFAGNRLLRVQDVVYIVGFSHDWIYQQIRRGEFPRPIKIATSSRWKHSNIESWMQSLANSDSE